MWLEFHDVNATSGATGVIQYPGRSGIMPHGYILGPTQLPRHWVSEVNQVRPEATTYFHFVPELTL
jgi:hypothetical protein